MTNTKYFTDCQTIEQLKQTYKRLAVLNHPDCGGNAETMKAINAEYEIMFPRLKDIHVSMSGETYTSSKPTQETPQEFINIINQLIGYEGVVIEIIGRFIWLSGNTRPYKDHVKAMGFKWHNKKVAWYLAPEDYRKRSRQVYSMDDIRDMFGCQTVETRSYEKIAVTA